jgi:glutamate/aspartate transport system substrate-binding protein
VDDSLRKHDEERRTREDLHQVVRRGHSAEEHSLNLPMSPALKQLMLEPNDKPLETYAK